MSDRAAALPLLPRIDGQDGAVLARIQAPVRRLFTDTDLAALQRSEAHRLLALFVARLAEASMGKALLAGVPSSNEAAASSSGRTLSQGAQRILDLLAELDRWTAEIERRQGPQRFGNIAFRDWGGRLEERVDELHKTLLPPHLHPFIVELKSPFLAAFGNWTRIDYGSGHELSFLLWLCYLCRLNFFGTYDDPDSASAAEGGDDGQQGKDALRESSQETEEIIALLLVPAYLRTVYAIQDRYSLEPAGSHGVWGLDDFHFLPYIIGAAQLSSQKHSSGVDGAGTSISIEPFKPRDILPPTTRQPPFANLYSSSIARILTLKHGGPFAEHSPMLTDIASSVPTWDKVLRGLLRMYEAEVLGKRVVVQLWEFGGVGWVWEGESRTAADGSSDASGAARAGQSSSRSEPAMAPTAAPWATNTGASSSGAGLMAPTAAPWASSSSSRAPPPPSISALGARLGVSRAMPPPPTSIASSRVGTGQVPTTPTPGRTSLYSTGSAAAASSPFGSLARSVAVPGRGLSSSSTTGPGQRLRDPLADEPDAARTR